MLNHFIQSNKIKLHYIQYQAENKKNLVMIHGITANAHAFDGVVHAGLINRYNIFCPDLRGRGLSEKPAFAYSLKDHALDIIGLLDHLNIDQASLVGHSYGGLLSAYIANHYPNRVKEIVFVDAAAELNPNSAKMLAPVFERLTKVYDSYEVFIESMKQSPQITMWDDYMEDYYCADIQMRADGRVDTIPNLVNMTAVAVGVANQNWQNIFKNVKVPSTIIVGTEDYNLGEPLLPKHKAEETAALMKDCSVHYTKGNHQTMLYGKNATTVSALINEFMK